MREPASNTKSKKLKNKERKMIMWSYTKFMASSVRRTRASTCVREVSVLGLFLYTKVNIHPRARIREKFIPNERL